MKCGNCCKTSSPIIYENDIERIANFLDATPEQIQDKYLKVDEDGDWVLNTLPCPFLKEDNHCQIYEARPTDCQEFPHTHKDDFASRSYQHSTNTITCPAVYYVVENMKDAVREFTYRY